MSYKYDKRLRVHYKGDNSKVTYCRQRFRGKPLDVTDDKAKVTCRRCIGKLTGTNYGITVSTKAKKKYEDFVLPTPTEEEVEAAEKKGARIKQETYDAWGRHYGSERR